MKISILDGFTTTQNDLNWDKFNALGQLNIFDRTNENDTVLRAKDACAILTNKVVLGKKQLDDLPNLKYIGVLATGYNVVDIKECKKRNITVTNIPNYSTASVAQNIFAHILNITNQIKLHSDSVKNFDWSNCIDFSYCLSNIIELKGKTLGIIGYGAIGKELAKIANAFEMNIIAYSPSILKNKIQSDKFACFKDLKYIFQTSDILAMCCPFNEHTENIICKKHIDLMKKNLIFINTARGAIVNEEDLANALNNGKIAAAGLDVLSSEPPLKTNPLLYAKNCFISPHNAWASKEARQRLIDIAYDNLNAFINNQKLNIIC